MTRLGEDYDQHHHHNRQRPSGACPCREQSPRWSASWALGMVHVQKLLLFSILLTVLQPTLAERQESASSISSEEDGGSGDGDVGGDFTTDKPIHWRPFRFVEKPRDQQVVASHLAFFTCRTVDTPDLTISWRKNGRPLTGSQSQYTVIEFPAGSVLRIEPVNKERDNAKFECVAENALGDTIRAQARLTVFEDRANAIPKGFPKFKQEPKNATVEANRLKLWNCKASGNPKPKVTWYKDLKPLDLDDPRYSVLPSGSLRIRESRKEDEGRYQCVAENKKGTAYSQLVTLQVRELE